MHNIENIFSKMHLPQTSDTLITLTTFKNYYMKNDQQYLLGVEFATKNFSIVEDATVSRTWQHAENLHLATL